MVYLKILNGVSHDCHHSRQPYRRALGVHALLKRWGVEANAIPTGGFGEYLRKRNPDLVPVSATD